MPTTDFSVTVADVLKRSPIDANQISATTEPVSTDDIETYIDDASSELAEMLRKWSIDPDQIDDDTLNLVQQAIEYYAVAEMIDVMPTSTAQMAQRYRDKWDEKIQQFKATPSNIDGTQSGLVTNIDPDDRDKPNAEFVGVRYKF